jgi:hypothetical protein
VAWEVKKMVEPAEEENQKRGGPARRRLGEEIDLGFCFCVVSPLKYQNCPPLLCVLKAAIYRQNNVWASKLVPQLSFFFKF